MNMQLTDEQFIRLWQTAQVFRTVVDQCGGGRMYAAKRACHLRRCGVMLKKFVPPKPGYGHLASLARRLEANP